MSITIPENVTKPELDMRLKGITDRQDRDAERTDERLQGLERLLDGKLAVMQMLMEKNLAQYQAVASEMKAEASDIRGEVKALAAQQGMLQSKIGWYISLLGIGLTVVIALVQVLVK